MSIRTEKYLALASLDFENKTEKELNYTTIKRGVKTWYANGYIWNC